MLIDRVNNIACDCIVRNFSNNNLITVQLSTTTDCKTFLTSLTKVIKVLLSCMNDTTSGKFRSSQNFHQLFIIFSFASKYCLSTFANALEVKRRNITTHCNCNTARSIYQHRRELNRKQFRLLSGIIVRRNHVHSIFINAIKHFTADCCQFRFSITRSSCFDIVRVNFTKVTFAINIRHIQRFIALCQTYHSIINGRVTMRVKMHRRTNNVCTLSSIAIHQLHTVHSIQDSSLNRLQTVY